MRRGSAIKGADGRRWRVRRRWLERPPPNLRRNLKAAEKDGLGRGVVEGLFSAPDLADSGASLALGAALLIVVLIALPLLGVALELLGVLVVLAAGLFARLALGRPWIVEAVDLDDPEHRVAYAVKGWRRSRDVLEALRAAIARGEEPEWIPGARALATRPER